MRRRYATALLLAVTNTLVVQAAHAAAPAPEAVTPVIACESFAGKSFYNVKVTAATPVAAANGLPAYCRVTGTENGTRHDVEVRLPDRWLLRYVQRGGGGFDGSVPAAATARPAFAVGAVQGVNNGGHRDPTGAALLGDARAIERYAHGAILTATRFGKALTLAYYGRPPAHSYYEGCSNGGRGALNAAAKYGPEFDGVVAVAPTLNLPGQIAMWTSAAALTMPTVAQFGQVHAAAVAKCDGLDGLRDGIVSHWQACTFDPARDVPASVGLTPPQVAALRAITQDLVHAGRVIYGGYGTGNLALGAPAFPLFGVGHMRSIVLGDAAWTADRFRIDEHLPRIAAEVEDRFQFSAAVPDLAQYLRGGGKVIVWHGADDALLSHRDTIRSWQDVVAAAGRDVAAANSRLYIAPGVNHCAGGAGADSIDALGALVGWVEEGRAPSTLVAAKREGPEGRVKFTRPLCEWPTWPRYRGRGNPDEAASFECVTD